MGLNHRRRDDARGGHSAATLQKDGVPRCGRVSVAEEPMEGAKGTIASRLDGNDDGVGVNGVDRVLSDEYCAGGGAVEWDGAVGGEAKGMREAWDGMMGRACPSAVVAIGLGRDQGNEKRKQEWQDERRAVYEHGCVCEREGERGGDNCRDGGSVW